MNSVRIVDNRVDVFQNDYWETGNLASWNEWFRCHNLRNYRPGFAERADEIRAALYKVGYFERETA